VFSRFIGITMIMFLLVAQAGEAFAVSSMTCFKGDRGMMMAEKIAKSMDHAVEQVMNSGLNEAINANDNVFSQPAANTQMMDHECCQQECDCPLGMLSLAVLIELNIQTISHLTAAQKIETDCRLVHAFIPSQKRPPKFHFNFVA